MSLGGGPCGHHAASGPEPARGPSHRTADGSRPPAHATTDVDDFAAVLAEAERVLTPGGLVLCYGAHPCFNGPHTELRDDGAVIAHPTYRLAGWHRESPWWGTYVRRRVGMRHHPLAELLTAFISAGLVIEHVIEPGDRPVPNNLAIRARKPAAQAKASC